ncbi:PE family protein [Mycolicibacter sinensis]|uniref:PE family protein n=1 Tax=Mycolicibacter sinensis (strain JDM601) TaxID=875328 RepID=F5YU11_MYCSD|nr:PE-PPE domain-containing protein [Mycolicibacter sinensis]AEF36202.1 PE family protein [Mycolicibacter sinensis]
MTVGLLAGGCAGLLGMTSAVGAGVALGDDTALIMGSAFQPTPKDSYIDQVMDYFLNPQNPFPGQPTFPGYGPVGVTTPQTDYGPGLTQGVADIDKAILEHLANGDNVTVWGYSMSAAVATQELVNLLALPPGEQPDPDHLSFVLLENLGTPNGGFFTRFEGSGMPMTPPDGIYHTDSYTIEYSGATDFPKYPLNFLALANAMAGYVSLHPALLPGWPTTFDPSSVADAVQLPTSEDVNTDYFLIPTQNLPLLDGIRWVPFFGPAMADLVQPALRVLIDLGYDRSDPADVLTPVSWSLPTIDWDTVAQNLELGFEQGWTAAQVQLGMLPESELPDLYPYLPDLSGLIGV